jgi:hypothetical protein
VAVLGPSRPAGGQRHLSPGSPDRSVDLVPPAPRNPAAAGGPLRPRVRLEGTLRRGGNTDFWVHNVWHGNKVSGGARCRALWKQRGGLRGKHRGDPRVEKPSVQRREQ